ncbi:hypothetical protein KKD70_04225 [Patescibacteria group bacterium]|nr:hypothetical protein [Patescibacteria group bacterium]
MKLKMKPWLKGGIIGVLIAINLFVFYIIIYLPLGFAVFAGNPPFWFWIPPFLSGHMIALISIEFNGNTAIAIFLAIYFVVGALIETYLSRKSAKK